MGGSGIDLARYEAARIELQDGLDRGVLAAASLTQTQDTDEIIRSFMKNVRFREDVTFTSSEETTMNSRKVSAQASYTMPTTFLHLVGVDTLSVSATSAAEEAKQNIEISLMLDMSGSMKDNNRIGNLKKAAKEFVDSILTDRTKDFTSMSIVPYAGHVNMGKAFFSAAGAKRTHSNSSCVEFDPSEYGGKFPDLQGREQVPHFTQWNYGMTNPNPWWCPLDSTSITYMANSATKLKTIIENMQMHDGTGTHNAMQWGYMLLDPQANKLIKKSIELGQTPSSFKDRPASFNDADTKKFIVLMTDGRITEQYRPKDYSRPVSQRPDNKQIMNSTGTRDRLYKICDAAKSKAITVFTIGFEVDSTGADQMRKCASSPAHFYHVSGLEISDAFKAISSTIHMLRLTQ